MSTNSSVSSWVFSNASSWRALLPSSNRLLTSVSQLWSYQVTIGPCGCCANSFLEPQISVIFRGWWVVVTVISFSLLSSSCLLVFPVAFLSDCGFVEGPSSGSSSASSVSSFHSWCNHTCFHFCPSTGAIVTNIDAGAFCDWLGCAVLMLFISHSNQRLPLSAWISSWKLSLSPK